jgi:hypothetical protein
VFADAHAGGFLVNLLDQAEWLEFTPCGLMSVDGPHARGWALQVKLNEKRQGLFYIHGSRAANARRRYVVNIADDLDALAELGAIVLVAVDAADDLGAISFSHMAGLMEGSPNRPTDDWDALICLPSQVGKRTTYNWAGDHGLIAQHICSELRRLSAPREPRLMYAALCALHLRSEPALRWLVEQFAGPDGDLARYLAIAPLVAHGRHDDALAALAALPDVADDERGRVEAEIERRR